MIESLYLVGSLRNNRIPSVANQIEQATGIEVFDGWYSPGPETDDRWKEHEEARGRTYREALDGYHAKDVFEFDKFHLDRCDAVALLCPAGKSAHTEFGYVIGQGKPGYYILEEDNKRWDIMIQFATEIFDSVEQFISGVQISQMVEKGKL